MSVGSDFKAFVMRGNVLDLAVGVIIGAAFGKIVTSLVNDILMPPIGKAMGGVDFKQMYYPLYDMGGVHKPLEEAQKGGAVIAYGSFINTIIDFIIVAFCIFMVVKLVNKLKPPVVPAPAGPPPQEVLLTEI